MRIPNRTSIPKQKSPGFTVIELLTVVIIIGVLAGFLASAILVARGKAKISGAIADLKNLELALTQFRDEFGYFPPSKVSDFAQYLTPGSTPPSTQSYDANFINVMDPATEANALRPLTGSGTARRSAFYEENGNELLVLFLMSKRHGGPFWGIDADRLQNKDGDSLPGNVLSSYFYDGVRDVTPLFEYYDRWDNPWVYSRYDRYNSDITASVDENSDGLSEIDGTAGGERTRRVNQIDSRTGTFFRKDSYQIYSFGPNGIDNLGYGGSARKDGIDNDQNGVVDDEDDIGNYHY